MTIKNFRRLQKICLTLALASWVIGFIMLAFCIAAALGNEKSSPWLWYGTLIAIPTFNALIILVVTLSVPDDKQVFAKAQEPENTK